MMNNYEIYFRKKGTKRWLRGGQYYITKKAAQCDMDHMSHQTRKGNYEYAIRKYKGV